MRALTLARVCALSPSSCPAKAGHPVDTGLSDYGEIGVYWVARFRGR
jgi:hypothetical protein